MQQLDDGILIETAAEAEQIVRRLADPTTKLVVYDSETSGLDPRRDFLAGHVFTFGPRNTDNYYVPVRHGLPPSGNITNPAKFHKALHKVASARRDLHWVGHNLMFDLRFMWVTGIEPAGTFEDTAVDQALLDEFSPSFALDACCRDHGVKEKKGEELYRHLASIFGGEPTRRAQMGNFWKLPGDDLLAAEYAMGDGISTWELHHAQRTKLIEQGLDGVRDTESKITRVLYRMMKRGVRIDWAKLAEVKQAVEDMTKKAIKALPAGFNVRSPNQIKAYMEAAGHTGWPLTPKGRPQFNEEWLSKTEEGRRIITVRKYTNLVSSFIDPLFEEHRWPDGRIRCEYWQMASDDFGTVTGRFSCSAPNLQQVPKRNKELGRLFRQVFLPEEGARWLSADMSQCEPRLLAHYSEAKVLLDGYLSVPFVDSHASVTRAAELEALLGVPFKEAREYGKRLNQSLITGAGKAKVISMLGAGGDKVYDAYFEALPEIKALQKTASKVMERRGYVRSFLGRRARLESRDKSYKAVNRILQVSNADLIKQSMVDMDAYFESEGDVVSLLNTVHDSDDLSVPEGAEAIAERGLEFMCQFGPGRRFDMMVPMAIEYRYGANWAQATYDGDEHIMGAEVNDPRFLAVQP